ncbi:MULTISPECIES: hypothetical protein [unclassified Campylobacter]|uniref:hypothetical protein n=1 Tax=unclassified Campylobacter TaxID=2593542 RepID=UPI0022E9B109|nr:MULTISPECIES: hypothetical protein [unclassified Campylobacter]MDA3056806.1 hypothetical protein [Campylobacter sp. CN_NA1]MDA3066002.1 hypothetical protein [Campylobacter sp. CN_NE4]MDA3069326.1 hypothetical protein [Campylobacter sp. CN_NE3]MDA3083328.1 hypothetical protein [Campylobacter sp. CN_EL2]MDA3084832.1 hypothetical protein [Campylobacter sp. CN_NE1]
MDLNEFENCKIFINNEYKGFWVIEGLFEDEKELKLIISQDYKLKLPSKFIPKFIENTIFSFCFDNGEYFDCVLDYRKNDEIYFKTI